jgi:hypothetical protein
MDKDLIFKPLHSLGFSDKFMAASKEMEFEKINDILAVAPMELVEKKGFNYNWLGELVTYLSKHGLVYLLQPLPGKNPG